MRRSLLRAKIDNAYEKKLIHTIRGMGYVLEDRADAPPAAYSLLQRLTLAFAVVAALVFALTGAYLYRSLSAELTRRDDIEISGKLNQFLQLAHASGSIAALRADPAVFHEVLLSQTLPSGDAIARARRPIASRCSKAIASTSGSRRPSRCWSARSAMRLRRAACPVGAADVAHRGPQPECTTRRAAARSSYMNSRRRSTGCSTASNARSCGCRSSRPISRTTCTPLT